MAGRPALRAIAYEALTFDDILLEPAYSEVLPSETDITTQVTRNHRLNIPILSAAMDTVTEAEMAIALAKMGGLGIIHRNLTPEQQAEEVRRVKRASSVIIRDPVRVQPDATIEQVRLLMKKHKISGIPVTDASGKLVGIVTQRDLRFAHDPHAPITTVMTPREKLITGKEGISLEEARHLLHKHRIEKLPLVDEEDRLVGLITYRDIRQLQAFPQASKDREGRLLVGAAVGTGLAEQRRAELLVEAGVDILCVDSAHGHSRAVLEMVRWLKRTFPQIDVIGGNVATPEGARALVEAGVDAVKVGVGPGSICTTRVIAGVGVPQVTAIARVYEALHGMGVPIIADGGIRYSGDIAKAIAVGADAVMLGNLLAGTEEAPGDLIIYEGRKFKVYRGMGSLEAMHAGGKHRYRQEAMKKLVPEGVVGRVPYRGRVSEVVAQLVGGLRVSMGYCGARRLVDLRRARIIRQTWAGMRESHVHDVEIIREAPNYTR